MRRGFSIAVLVLALVGSFLPGPFTSLAQGQIYTDSMDSAETGLLSTETFDPSISFTYANSQFVVDVQQPSYRGDIISTLNVPEMASSRLTVDAFIAGDPSNKYVIAGCRRTDRGEGYFFGYLPATGEVLIWRHDASGRTTLAQSVEPDLIAPENTMHQIGIECLAGIMTGIVNGQPVMNVVDVTYALGRPTIGLGANGLQTDGLTVSFDNLSVEDLGNVQLVDAPTVTPVPGSSSITATGQMTPIHDPLVDPTATLNDAFTISLNVPPVVSDLGGDTGVSPGTNVILPAGVQVADFYAEIYYTTPTLPAGSGYLVGFTFWADSAGNSYDFYVGTSGSGVPRWGYGKYTPGGNYQPLLDGDMPPESLDPTPGATNFLSLTVYQGVAILSGNTYGVDVAISLEGTPIAGDVGSEVGYFTSDRSTAGDPHVISTSGFAVWDLSSGMVPVVSDSSAVATEPPAVVAPPPTEPLPTASGPDTGTTTLQFTQMTDPNLDPAATLSEAFTISLNLTPIALGMGEDIELSRTDLYQLAAGVQVADFYTELYYTTPSVPVGTSYLVGFCFWTDPAGNCYDLFIEDDGSGASRWGYGYDTNDGVYESLQTGEMPAGSLDPTPGATNFLGLTVYQGVAILSSNTFGADVVIPLEGTPIAGDVQAEAAFLDANQSGVTDSLALSISDFAVWDLSSGMVPVVDETGAVVTETVEASTTAPETLSGPLLPPLQSATGGEALFDQTRNAAVLNPSLMTGGSGSLPETDGVYAYTVSGVNLADFYTIVTFTNPTDAPAPFDVGIGFRDDKGSEGGLRFTVTSAGTWYMQVPGQEPYASGAAASFVLTPGASNTIEVLVQGTTGTVAINGVLLPQLDLSTIPNRGDIYLGAGFFQGDTVTGRVIAYSDWWIYPTDPLDIPSG